MRIKLIKLRSLFTKEEMEINNTLINIIHWLQVQYSQHRKVIDEVKENKNECSFKRIVVDRIENKIFDRGFLRNSTYFY